MLSVGTDLFYANKYLKEIRVNHFSKNKKLFIESIIMSVNILTMSLISIIKHFI